MNFWYIEHYGASVGDDFYAKKELIVTYVVVIQSIPLHIDH